eukprot:1163712-Amphidinium_carterae.1
MHVVTCVNLRPFRDSFGRLVRVSTLNRKLLEIGDGRIDCNASSSYAFGASGTSRVQGLVPEGVWSVPRGRFVVATALICEASRRAATRIERHRIIDCHVVDRS